MVQSFSEDYQVLYDEYESAYQLWSYPLSKYREIDPAVANKYMTLIQNFSVGDSEIIEACDKF